MPLASSDWFRVSFDSFYDKRAGFRFDVNPAGVRRDSTLTTAGVSFSAGPLGGSDGDLAWRCRRLDRRTAHSVQPAALQHRR
jgi:hypothetical protein